MDIIRKMTEWVTGISLGEVKCGILKSGSNEASFRSTVAHLNRTYFFRKGWAVHVRSFWRENAVGIVCVSRKDFDEHKKDSAYENEWQCKIDNVYYGELETKESR